MTLSDPAGLLRAAADQFQLALSPIQIQQLLAYAGLLQRWNKTYNLTALRNPVDVLTHHLVDSMSVWGPLLRAVGSAAGKRILDVGSGGGLPGVVLAILEPAMAVTCVDAVGKKAAFVQHVKAELQLRNLTSVHARVEAFQDVDGFDIIVSRAFSALQAFVTCSAHLLANDGVWVAMKGKHPVEEAADLPPTVDLFHVEHISVPGLGASRCLVWMRRTRAGDARV